LIYGGQESAAVHTPSLFDLDPIIWDDYELQPFLTLLAHLKKDPAQVAGRFVLVDAEPAIQAAWYMPGHSLYGVFNVGAAKDDVAVRLPDGTYADLLSGTSIRVQGGRMPIPDTAAILRYSGEIDLEPFYSDLLDFNFDRR
jgi:hypothetical protein